MFLSIVNLGGTEVRVRFVSVLCVCTICLLLTQIPNIRAGSFTVAPSTIYGTAISFSASYPDFHFDESPNVSLTISATFNNASISAFSLWHQGILQALSYFRRKAAPTP
jgi:hypothetical protein